MKKLIAILAMLFCVYSIQAQSNNTDSKLLAKYSQKELKKMKKNNPDEYEFVKYCVKNAYYVANSSKEKVAKDPGSFGEITISDLSDINFFELNIELKQSEFQAFVIKGTDKLLMVRSKDFIQKELKK